MCVYTYLHYHKYVRVAITNMYVYVLLYVYLIVNYKIINLELIEYDEYMYLLINLKKKFFSNNTS